MSSDLFGQEVKSIHTDLTAILLSVQQLTQEVNNKELEKTINELALRMDEPFMFVIVGEVKAGKSSFINALLETTEEIAKVAPDPCTDSIQQLKYASEPSEQIINEHYKQIFQPFDILKSISIVDTPGTNTIIDHHQEITERFVPIADLIVFVFEAKNPYRESSWAFFDFINKEWRKKVVFVLQQKDLVTADALQINIDGVIKTAKEKGIDNPQVFAVSALDEIQQKQNSGFGQLRNYIQTHITDGHAPYLKLENISSILRNINVRIYTGLVDRKEQYQADFEFREDIRKDLDTQENRSKQQVDILIDNLLEGYDRVSDATARDLRDGLSFFVLLSKSFKSIFKKDESPKIWLNDLQANFESELNNSMKDKLNDGVGDLADSIQNMAKIIELKLHNNSSILSDTDDLFSHIAQKRKSVLVELREAFGQFLSKSENFKDDELFASTNTITPDIVTGSGVAVVGIIIATLTKGIVFDVTGGVISIIGLFFAGITTGMRRKKIVKGFRAEIQKGRMKLEDQLRQALNAYILNIRSKIDAIFADFDQMLAVENTAIKSIEINHAEVEKSLDETDKSIKNSMTSA